MSKMWRKMWWTTGRTPTMPALDALAIFAVTLLLATSASIAFALSESPAAGSSPSASGAPASEPATRVVPSDETEPPAATAPSEAGATSTTATPAKKKPRTHHKTVAAAPELEPATARLKVIRDGWIYAAPSKSSKKIEKATVGKFVDVTGSTKYYLQAKLRDGQTGYIAPSEVELVKPTDQIFLLTQDAAVLDAPNRWAKKLAEVHRKHNVHVIGISLNYMRIRMKSGLSGFIPVTALQ